MLLPLSILVAMILGIVYQQHSNPTPAGGSPGKK